MDDIICTVPEQCGEKDCPVGWHLAHYWAYDDGTYSVCDCDGNHDGCDADDLPTADDVHEAWMQYARYVADTGTDPLHEYTVRRDNTTRERYTAAFRKSVLGASLVEVKRRGARVPLPSLPQHVAEYLCVQQGTNPNVWLFDGGWDALAALTDTVTVYRGVARATFCLDRKTPRSPDVVSRELRAAARRSLRRSHSR